MPVRLRLARHGTRNSPFYHLVAIADHKPRDARPIEKLGEYDPIPRIRKFLAPQVGQHGNAAVTSSGLPSEEDLKRKEKRLEWNTERIRYWLSVGAQPSKPVAKMLDKAGLIPEGKWFKGMYRPPAEATHFNPQLEGATEAEAESVSASSSPPPPSSDPSANGAASSSSST